jgi:hypothetical protein
MTRVPDEQLDAMILSVLTDRWQKVAMAISCVMKIREVSEALINEHDVAERISQLSTHARIAGRGLLREWRNSEIKLPDR